MNQQNINALKVNAIIPKGVTDKPFTVGALLFNKMKEIKLTQSKVALVDDEDYEFLNQFKWCASHKNGRYYAGRGYRIKGKCKSEVMHRVIMNPPKGMVIDHKDHNGLNNQRSNLRICTQRENSYNKIAVGKSKFIGVFFDKKRNKFSSTIRIYKNRICLGYFDNEIDAARAYDESAILYHRDFANLNFPNES